MMLPYSFIKLHGSWILRGVLSGRLSGHLFSGHLFIGGVLAWSLMMHPVYPQSEPNNSPAANEAAPPPPTEVIPPRPPPISNQVENESENENESESEAQGETEVIPPRPPPLSEEESLPLREEQLELESSDLESSEPAETLSQDQEEPIISGTSIEVKIPPSYVLEIEAGINYFGYNTNETIDRYGFNSIEDTLAIAYNVKSGVLYKERWMSLLIFGYSKRPNYEYPISYLEPGMGLQEVHQHYRLGIEQQYLFARYSSRINIGVGLEGSWLRRRIQFNESTNIETTTGTNVGETNISLTGPETLRLTEYALIPKIKLLYRISNFSVLHLAMEYHYLLPSRERYPQYLLGIDISFFLYKPKEPQ